MMLIQSQYEAIRDGMLPGDGVVFGASGGFLSSFIKFWTRSALSHCSTVLTLDEALIADLIAKGFLVPPKTVKPGNRVVLVESTILSNKDGVQVNWASERIAEYPGSAWWLPLSQESREIFDTARFSKFMVGLIGHPYDKQLIGHLLFDKLHLVPARKNWDKMICSECGSAGYKVAGILPMNLNSSEVVPQRMAEYRLYRENYYQVRGKAQEIRRYNDRAVTA
jgi:hypothetical protein